MFKLTKRQEEGARILSNSVYTDVLFRGGSRSGKTFLLMLSVVTRALKEAGSRHLVCRKVQQNCIRTLWYKTFVDVIDLVYPSLKGVIEEYKQPRWVKIFPNGSEIHFGGLDDKERVDKILGDEYSTIYFNECSEISYDAVETVKTRVAQKNGLVKKRYYDCNPTTANHWTYRVWFEGKEPLSNRPLMDAGQYIEYQMNPIDNVENLDSNYLRVLEGMSEAKKRRFLYGEYAVGEDVAVFREGDIKYYTVSMDRWEFESVVLSCDTAFKDNEYSDYSGFTVWGKKGGNYYLLDLERAKLEFPALKRRVVELAARWSVDNVVIEDKGSGQSLIQDLRATTDLPIVAYNPYNSGKVLRAGYASQYFEQGRVWLPAGHNNMEDFLGELLMFPLGENDDWVDSVSQYFHWVRYDYYNDIDERKEVGYIEYIGGEYEGNQITGY